MKEISISLHTFPEYFQIKYFENIFKIIHKNQWRHWLLVDINEMQMSKKN